MLPLDPVTRTNEETKGPKSDFLLVVWFLWLRSNPWQKSDALRARRTNGPQIVELSSEPFGRLEPTYDVGPCRD